MVEKLEEFLTTEEKLIAEELTEEEKLTEEEEDKEEDEECANICKKYFNLIRLLLNDLQINIY